MQTDLAKLCSSGATVCHGGVNFSLFSRDAAGVELLSLTGRMTKAGRVIGLDPASNRTYHYWHVFVPAVRPGQIYGYRVQGPFDPANGMRFDPPKFFSTHTAVASLSPRTTAGRLPVEKATTRRRDEERGGGPDDVRLGR